MSAVYSGRARAVRADPTTSPNPKPKPKPKPTQTHQNTTNHTPIHPTPQYHKTIAPGWSKNQRNRPRNQVSNPTKTSRVSSLHRALAFFPVPGGDQADWSLLGHCFLASHWLAWIWECTSEFVGHPSLHPNAHLHHIPAHRSRPTVQSQLTINGLLGFKTPIKQHLYMTSNPLGFLLASSEH